MTALMAMTEALPVSYPDAPDGLGTAAAALDADMIWQRIESYVAHRWTAREVVWIVEGPGEFKPGLHPATITAREVWDGVAWITASLSDGPLGGVLLNGEGPYRFTATVGSGDVPATVQEAFRRLAEYMAETVEHHGAHEYSVSIGELDQKVSRYPTWLARAMQYSGAADLLRPYRRA